MKLLSWAVCILGLWILLTSVFGTGQAWIGIVGGLAIAILAIIPALTAKT